MIKIKLNKVEKNLFYNYINSVNCIYKYFFFYKINAYYNYLKYNSKDENIIYKISKLNDIYLLPDILNFKIKYSNINILDDKLIINILNNINDIFLYYFIKENKFPSFYYNNLYNINKFYFVKNYYSIYSKYLSKYDFDKIEIYLKIDYNRTFYLILIL